MNVSLFILVVNFQLIVCLTENNVCKTFMGYYTNTSCYYNPDQFLDVPEIIERYGYNVEIYRATTEDGYILTLFRIPSKSNSGVPVFLQHGIYSSAICFINTGNKSLAFILADAGYDVWLGNFRGNRYSRDHKVLSNQNFQFWKFSVHELGLYDTGAQIGLVNQITGQSIVYIGYSMGTTSAFIYSINSPDLARQHIKSLISLAPIAYLNDIPSSVVFLKDLWVLAQHFFDIFQHGEMFNRNSDISKFIRSFCLSSVYPLLFCSLVLQTVFGQDPSQLDPETLPITIFQSGESVSTKTVSHYRQILEGRRFQQYDYGINENLVRYNSTIPPVYNISQILVPTYLVYSENDFLATETNVLRFYNELSNQARMHGTYKVPYRHFSHSDFMTAKDVKSLLYNHLLKFIARL